MPDIETSVQSAAIGQLGADLITTTAARTGKWTHIISLIGANGSSTVPVVFANLVSEVHALNSPSPIITGGANIGGASGLTLPIGHTTYGRFTGIQLGTGSPPAKVLAYRTSNNNANLPMSQTVKAYNSVKLGQLGADVINDTTSRTGKWCAIQAVRGTSVGFTTLYSETIGLNGAAPDPAVNLNALVIPLGAIVFGRFTTIQLSSTTFTIVAYRHEL